MTINTAHHRSHNPEFTDDMATGQLLQLRTDQACDIPHGFLVETNSQWRYTRIQVPHHTRRDDVHESVPLRQLRAQ